jgi:hypothetical protein
MRNHRHLDDRTADRLLAAAVEAADAPPGFAGVAGLFGQATSDFELAHADPALLATMADEIVAAPQPIATRRKKTMPAQLLSAKVAAAAAAVVLSATGAAAATGTLPDAAQRAVADAVSHVGISIENPSDDHPTGTADNPTDADEHGDTVSGTARDTDATGAEKGAEISTTARGDHGQAPAATGAGDAPAPVDTPNGGGTGTPDGVSHDGASQAGTANAPADASDGSANADDTPADGAPYGADNHPSGRP